MSLLLRRMLCVFFRVVFSPVILLLVAGDWVREGGSFGADIRWQFANDFPWPEAVRQ